MRVRPTIAVLALGLALPAAAAGQIMAPPEEVPKAASVVISARDARLSSAGFAYFKAGCNGDVGDLCLGRMTISLPKRIVIPPPQTTGTSSDPKKKPKPTIINPFTLGGFDFGIPDGAANRYRVRLPVRVQMLVRKLGSIQVLVSADFAGSNGVRNTQARTLRLYVPLAEPDPPSPASLR